MPNLDFSFMFSYIIDPIVTLILYVSGAFLAFVLGFAVYAIIKLRLNPFHMTKSRVRRLRKMKIRLKLLNFLRWLAIDAIYYRKFCYKFNQYGLTVFCGRQGAGKTISMVNYAIYAKNRFPDCIIVANFKFKYADFYMEDWQDFLKYRNGTKGVLFLIDEIHGEYSSQDWKDFPENLLSQISQQRKQRIKIACTSQVYSRVVKQIREQSFSVVQCLTFLNRWTFNREYDARDYEMYCESAEKKKKLKPIRKSSFIQDDCLRNSYDTYEVIKRMKKIAKGEGFIPRNERMT